MTKAQHDNWIYLLVVYTANGNSRRAKCFFASALLFGKISLTCAFNISSHSPFLYPGVPHWCERYAWSGTFAGNMIGQVLSICVFTGLPLVLGTNPKFFMLDV